MASQEEVAAMRALFEQQQQRFTEQQQAFDNERAARDAQMQQLLTSNQAMTGRIDDLLKMGQAEQDRRVQLEKELQEERARSAQARPLVDVSKIGQKQPEKFTEKDTAWPTWAWAFRNYLAAANPATRPAMAFAKDAGDDPIDEEVVATRGWTVFSDQLYSSLVGFTTGESASIVMNTKEGNGLEAWRKLERRWHSAQIGSLVADKMVLPANEPVADAGLGKAVQDWEVKRTEYEAKHKEQLRDDDAQIALAYSCFAAASSVRT